MGRSVDYLSGAHTVCYEDVSEIDEDYGWDDFTDNLHSLFQSKFPSIEPCERWEGDEVSIILENQLIEIGVSEYCSLASISMRVKDFDEYDNYDGLATRHADIVGKWMDENIGDYVKVGSFSNGEGVYEKKER